MAVSVKPAVNRGEIIKWAISILVPIIILLIPVNAVFTSQMRTFFAITVCGLFVIAFEFFDNIVPAIIMPAAWVFFGVTTIDKAFSGFMGTIAYMVLGAFLLATVLEEIGLLQRLAYWCLVKAGGNFMGLLLGLFLAGLLLTLVTFGNGYIIMAAISYGVCKAMKLQRGRTSAAVMMACILGAVAARVYNYSPTTISVLVQNARLVVPGFDINFYQASGHNWPLAVASLICLFIVYNWYGPKEHDADSKAYFQNELTKMGPMTPAEKKALVVVAILLVYLLSVPLHGFATDWGFIFIPWLMFFPGFRVCKSPEVTIKNVNFSMLFFVVACMGIGTTASSLGLGNIIAEFCLPLFQGGNIFTQVSLVYAVCFVLNFLMTPLAIFSLITVPLCEIALMIGVDPRVFVYTILHACEAIILPYEYVPYLIAYSFGMMTMVDFIKLNVMRTLIYFAGFLLLVVPYWMLLGII